MIPPELWIIFGVLGLWGVAVWRLCLLDWQPKQDIIDRVRKRGRTVWVRLEEEDD